MVVETQPVSAVFGCGGVVRRCDLCSRLQDCSDPEYNVGFLPCPEVGSVSFDYLPRLSVVAPSYAIATDVVLRFTKLCADAGFVLPCSYDLDIRPLVPMWGASGEHGETPCGMLRFGLEQVRYAERLCDALEQLRSAGRCDGGQSR